MWASREARNRRAQIRLFHSGIQIRRPFWRFLWATANIRIVLILAVWMMFWVFTAATRQHPVEWMTFFWILFTGVEVTYWSAVFMHKLVMQHWPSSMKIKIGSMHPFPAGEFRPGAIIRTLSLPKGEGTDEATLVPVELIKGGYVSGTQKGITKDTGLFAVAPARFKSADGRSCSGILLGDNEFFIPAHAEVLMFSDMDNWASPSYGQLLKEVFGTKVTDSSVVILAMDPYDIEKADSAPPREAYRRQEIYEVRQREKQTTRRHMGELRRDQNIESIRRGMG